MAIEITVESAKKPDDSKRGYDVYSVHIGDHRILTVFTENILNLSKWLKNVLKSSPSASDGDTILIGVSAYRESGDESSAFGLLSLCVGSHCLLYLFPPRYDADKFTAKYLNSFFENPRVRAVAFNAVALTENLEKIHGVKIENAVDVVDIARRSRPELNFFDQHNLDDIVEKVIRRDMIIDRPERKNIPWFTRHGADYWNNPLEARKLSADKIKYSCLDSYLCFLMATSSCKKTIKSSDEVVASSAAESPASSAAIADAKINSADEMEKIKQMRITKKRLKKERSRGGEITGLSLF